VCPGAQQGPACASAVCVRRHVHNRAGLLSGGLSSGGCHQGGCHQRGAHQPAKPALMSPDPAPSRHNSPSGNPILSEVINLDFGGTDHVFGLCSGM
jgi:hypothetical protein